MQKNFMKKKTLLKSKYKKKKTPKRLKKWTLVQSATRKKKDCFEDCYQRLLQNVVFWHKRENDLKGTLRKS